MRPAATKRIEPRMDTDGHGYRLLQQAVALPPRTGKELAGGRPLTTSESTTDRGWGNKLHTQKREFANL